LPSTLAQLADVRGKLLHSVNDTFPDYLLALVSQLALVPGLHCDHRENGEDDEHQ
jgi:hypothetical protein